MSGRSKDNWRGGKKTERSVEREAAGKPSWKQGTTKRHGKRRTRRWAKLAAVTCLIGLFVGLGIWLYNPEEPLHTHFVMLDLLTDSTSGGPSSELFDPSTAVSFPEPADSDRPFAKFTSSASASLKFVNDESRAQIHAAHVVIVWLQSHLVCGPDGSCRCLTRDSTPDMNDDSTFEESAVLRDEILQLIKLNKRVVLIVDESSSHTRWREGDFEPHTICHFLKWPEHSEFQDRLVVVTARARESRRTVPHHAGVSGVGAMIQVALSEAADDDKNMYDTAKNLSLVEFCSHLHEAANRLAAIHGLSADFSIQMSPSLKTIKTEPDRNFVLLGDLPAAPSQPEVPKYSAQSQLAGLWERRDTLNQQLAWRWNPVLWTSSTELLLRAQDAMLNGHDQLAGKLAARASQEMSQLEDSVKSITHDPALFDASRGLPVSWFEGLPAAASAAFGDAYKLPPRFAPIKSASQVVQQHLDQFPFETSGFEPDTSKANRIKEERSLAEKTRKTMTGVAGLIQTTLRNAEVSQLRQEDSLFVRTPAQTDPAVDWKSIADFIQAHQSAEVVYQQVLAQSPFLARWAADFPFHHDQEFERAWQDLLGRNLPSTYMALADIDTAADQLGARTTPGINTIAVPARADIFRLLCCTRALGLLLSVQEPESGHSSQTLRENTKRLLDLTARCRTLLQATGTAFTDLAGKLANRTSTVARNASQRTQIHQMLRLPDLDSKSREALLRQLNSVNRIVHFPDDEELPTDLTPAVHPSPSQEALWAVQHLNLFVDAADNDRKTGLHDAAARLVSDEAQPQPGVLAVFGEEVRLFWLNARRRVNDSMSAGTDVRSQLIVADRLSRGLSGFDFQQSGGDPTQRLHTLQQFEQCVANIDALLAGQWIESGDMAPMNRNGWYARAASPWIRRAEKLAGAMGNGRDWPAFARAELDKRNQLLDQSDGWSVTPAAVSSAGIDLGDSNQQDADIRWKLRREGAMPQGTASLTLRRPADAAETLTVPENGTPLGVQDQAADSFVLKVHREGAPGEGDDCQAFDVYADVFFRGRIFSAAEPIVIDPCAAEKYVTKRLARPPTGTVTVSGDDVRPYAFVLDMSGSMGPSRQNEDSRHKIAVDTFDDVLNSLDAPVRASLRVFGHRVRYDTNDKSKFQKNNVYEDEFKRKIPNMDPQRDTEVLVPLTTLDNAGRKQLGDTIKRVEPFGSTPLLRSIKLAITQDLSRKPGIVLAVTDGIATDAGIDLDTYQLDDANAPSDQSAELRDVIKEHPGTKILVVAFDLTQDELKALRAIMKRCDESESQIEIVASNRRDLAKAMKSAKDPISWQLTSKDYSRNAELGAPVESVVPQADYQIRYSGIAPASDVPVGPGDHIQPRVNWKDKSFSFRRDLYTNWTRAAEQAAPTPWMLREVDSELLQFRNEEGVPLEFGEVTVELLLDHGDQKRPVRQPVEVEFRLNADDGFRAARISEEYTSENNAPGYRFVIPSWPREQKIRVDAAWKMERTTPETVKPLKDLPDPYKLTASGDLPAATVTRTLKNGVLEVRLEPAPGTPVSADRINDVSEIRVEIGERGELQDNRSFDPVEFTTETTRLDDGAVVFRFMLPNGLTEEWLAQKEIAFTSRASRMKGTIKPATLDIRPRLKFAEN